MVKFYTIHCDACDILQSKLDSKNIKYDLVDDTDTVIAVAEKSNITSAPILEVDGVVMDYRTALKWVKEQTV